MAVLILALMIVQAKHGTVTAETHHIASNNTKVVSAFSHAPVFVVTVAFST